jgi:hypothetical protein
MAAGLHRAVSLLTAAALVAGGVLLGLGLAERRRSGRPMTLAPSSETPFHGQHRHSSYDTAPSNQDARLSHDDDLDPIDRASADSFPASDPPSSG